MKVIRTHQKRQFWKFLEDISLSLLVSVDLFRATETTFELVNTFDEFILREDQVAEYRWIKIRSEKVYGLVKLHNGMYVFVKGRFGYSKEPGGSMIVGPSPEAIKKWL